MTRKEVQRMDVFNSVCTVFISYGCRRIRESSFEKTDKNRVGVIIGSGIGGMWTYHKSTRKPI